METKPMDAGSPQRIWGVLEKCTWANLEIGDDPAVNWDDLRYVLALAEAGSLARAARKLKVDHTTVGRRIEALEVDVGVRLFTRTTNGYTLTREAEEFLPDIRQIEANVLALERSAVARQNSIK